MCATKGLVLGNNSAAAHEPLDQRERHARHGGPRDEYAEVLADYHGDGLAAKNMLRRGADVRMFLVPKTMQRTACEML